MAKTWCITSASTVTTAVNRGNSKWIWAGSATGIGLSRWIEPTKGPNVYEEYLKKHGEGVHHVGVDVKDIHAAVKAFEGKGGPAPCGVAGTNPRPKDILITGYRPARRPYAELLWNQPMPK